MDSTAIPGELGILLFTLRIAAESTIVIFPLALALAWLTRSLPVRLRTIIESAATLPLILPPTAVGFVLLDLLSRDGPLGRLMSRSGGGVLFTPAAAVIAAAVMSFPLMFRSFRVAIESSNFRYFDIARTLGATRIQAFFRIVVPLSWQGILSGVLLAYCRALGEFGATILIAGNIPGRTQTIALAIYERVQSGREEEARLLLLSVVVIAFAAVALSELLARSHRERVGG